MPKLTSITRSFKQIVKIIFAIIIAIICQWYFDFSNTSILIFATIIVMITYTGAALFQGLVHLIFLLSGIILIAWISSSQQLYLYSYDVLLGGLIGIIVNIFIFPDKVANAFRQEIIPILHAEDQYFTSIVHMFTDNKIDFAEKSKQQLELALCQIPIWIYEKGLDITFQAGHRHFLDKIIQLGDILFGLHVLAREAQKPLHPSEIQPLLTSCSHKFHHLVQALITILQLKEWQEPLIDFDSEIIKIDQLLTQFRPALEVFELNRNLFNLYKLTKFLKELHDTTLNLAKSLR